MTLASALVASAAYAITNIKNLPFPALLNYLTDGTKDRETKMGLASLLG